MHHRIGIWSDDAPHIRAYAQEVGALVVAFGFLEYLSYVWIVLLQRDHAVVELAANLGLRERIALITKMVEREFVESKRTEALNLWRDVANLSDLRNAVCHNPYVFGDADGNDSGEPCLAFTYRTKDALRNLKKRMTNRDDIARGRMKAEETAERLLETITALLESGSTS